VIPPPISRSIFREEALKLLVEDPSAFKPALPQPASGGIQVGDSWEPEDRDYHNNGRAGPIQAIDEVRQDEDRPPAKPG
jgi:hypothetical protein